MLICCRRCKEDIDSAAEQPLKCERCHFYYHFPQCCETYKNYPYKLFLGDTYYRYTCDSCITDEQRGMQLLRLAMSWLEIVEIMRKANPEATEEELLVHLEEAWPRFWANQPVDSGWKTQFTLSLSGKSSAASKGIVEGIVTEDGFLLPVPTSRTVFGPPARRSRQTSDIDKVLSEAKNEKEEGDAESLGFKSSKALKTSLKKLASTYTFSNLDFDRPNPEHPIVVSKASTHTAQQLIIEGHTVKGLLGYAMARTTHGFDSGSWYFEVNISESCSNEAHVRLGLAQILAECQAPVGYDEYSYGIRDKDGAVMHCGRHKEYARAFGPGDTIGILLNLPSDPTNAPCTESLRAEMEKAYPPKGLGTYKVRQEILATPADSQIRFFINGQDCGPAFENIYKAKYYPAVSLFKGAEATFNFGPEFRFPCPKCARPAFNIAES